MGMKLTLAIAALTIAVAGAARADTYNPVYCGGVDTCGGNAPKAGTPSQAGAPPPAPPVQPVGPSLSDQLRQQLSGSAPTSAQKQQAIARVNNALQRLNTVVATAGQTTDPQVQAQLRQQYAAALADMRKGIGQVEAATSNPTERAGYQDWEQQTEQQLAQQMVQAGAYSAQAPVAATPAQPNPGGSLRDQLRQSLSQSNPPATTHMVRQQCHDAKGAPVPNCFYQMVEGQCMKQTLGQVGWDPTLVPTDQCPGDLKQSYCQAYPQLSAGICPAPKQTATAKAPPANQPPADADPAPAPFTMGNPSDNAREIQKLIPPDPSEAFLRQLPPQCAAMFGAFLTNTYSAKGSAVGTAESRQHDTQMATQGFGALEASPECRDAIQRIANANSLFLPVRRLSPRVRGAFDTAMAADPNQPIATASGGSGAPDDGYDPSDVLDFGMALLNLAGGFAGVANAMHNVPHIGGGFRAAPQYPRAISCNYSGCVTTGGSAPNNNQPTITGIGSH